MVGSIWGERYRMQKRLNSLFEDFFRSEPFFGSERILPASGPLSLLAKSETFDVPLTDLWETKKEFRAEIDLPGIDKKDILLNIKKGSVEVKAEKKHEKKEGEKGVHRLERSYQGYCRSFSLPKNAEVEKAVARYENAVLKISIPKKELPEYKPKQIEIK